METMQWIIPITVIPGIALIILSTSNILLSLNNEVTQLHREKEKYGEIIKMKLQQMKRLNWSLVLLYIGILIFLVSGVLGAITDPDHIRFQFHLYQGKAPEIMTDVSLV